MSKWLGRIRGAVGMGLTWAAGWALVGVLIGVTSMLFPNLPWNSFFAFFDAPLPALAVPGFFAGALFSIVLGIAGRRRRFDELSLLRFTAWGALGGLLLSLVPAALVAGGFASVNAGASLWRITAIISGPLTLLSTVSAAGSLMLARFGQKREVRGASDDVAQAGPVEGGAQALVGSGDSFLDGNRAVRHTERDRSAPARGPRD